MLRRMEDVAARFSFVKACDIGMSVLGRPLRLLRMGEGRKKVFVSAAHHGNEWITALLLLRYAEAYAAAYAANARLCGAEARTLFESTELFLLPLVNPDGADIAMGLIGGENEKAVLKMAKARPDVPYPTGWKANFHGTDLNLNYPAGWEIARLNKKKAGVSAPGPRDWAGAYPLCEPETLALYTLTRAQNFCCVIAFHTQGEEIYWRYGKTDPPGARALAEKLAAASGYPLKETPYASAFAGYKDWFIQSFFKPGFTVEAGLGTSPLPLRDLDSIYEKNAPLITAALLGVQELK